MSRPNTRFSIGLLKTFGQSTENSLAVTPKSESMDLNDDARIWADSEFEEIHERNKNTLKRKTVIPAINQSSVICTQIEIEIEIEIDG
jgi:hypothetical protein